MNEFLDHYKNPEGTIDIGLVAKLVDKQIHVNYKLWPSNYLAYDLLNNTSEYSDQYNDDIKTNLEIRYEKTALLTGYDNKEIRKLFLQLYANPVINKLAAF